MTSVKGLGASLGIAIGSSYIYENEINFESPTSISFEVAKSNLIKRFKKQIESFKSKDRIDEAEVLDAYILILEDPEITSQFDENSDISTEKVFEVFSSTASIFDSMEDDYFKQRSEDIISVGKHLIFAMQDKDTSTSFEENTILIANDLTPADTSSMDLNKVSGIILKEGGFTSHAVIVAKNLGIPCVIGLKESVNDVLPGTEIAIDGDSGEVILSPSEEIITDLKRKSENINLVISNFTKDKYEKLGVDFRINVGSSEEINNFEHLFLDSIGLFRSEFIYLDRQSPPTLEDQKKVLSELSEKFKGTIVYRTLDIGGDKQVKYLNLPVEENPFLGVRGIRLSLDNKDIFYSQVRSILESDCIDRVKVMFPMVSTIEDFLDAKNYVNEIAEELGLKTPPLGIMVETPSSALMSDQFSEVVDFISIGTNDLTQYIMAADRGNGNLTRYQNPLHPAVLRAISDVINNCRKNKIEVSVCGEMASDPISALALYILGLRTFSMSPSAAPFVFEILEENFENIPEKFEEKILSATNAEEVTLLIKENIL